MLDFAGSETAPVPGGAAGRGNVLLVDDNGPQRDALARVLRDQGFFVDVVSCGEPAVAAVTRASPDAVVMDLCRPDTRNSHLCPRMKQAARGLLPVLHLSMTSIPSAERARVLDDGADAYLVHPFEADELRASVAALVRLARQDRERMETAAMTAVMRGALDSLADHIALLGAHGEVVAVNRAWSDFAKANGFVGPDSGIGSNYLVVCRDAVGRDADEAHYIGEQVRRVVADETSSIEVEYACPSPTEERWFRVGARRMSGSGGVVAIVTHSALTQERLAARAEAVALKLAEADRARLQATLDAIPVGIWIADRHGDATHSNPAVERIWAGASPLLSGTEGHAAYRAWRPGVATPIAYEDWPLIRTIRTGATITDELLEIARFDGTRGYVLNSSAGIHDAAGALIGAIAITVDVTERQAAVAERELLVKSLELERSHLEAIFEQAPSFLAVLRGPDFVFERTNPAYFQLVGNRDVIGLALLDAMPELKGQGFVELLEQVGATGQSFTGRQVPVQLARAPGAALETRYVDMVYQRLVDADGSFALLAHGVDVTDQVRATNAVRRSEEVLREQFAKLPVPTLLWEARGQDFILIDANDAAYRAFPLLRDDSIGHSAREMSVFPDILNADRQRCLDENTVVRRSLEFDAGAPVGMRHFDITMGPQQPNRVLVHWEDTTERLQLEGQLRQSQKLEAVGQLAGGIAHDFNNLLTVIIAYAGMLIAELPPEDENRLAVVEIEHAAQRAADLTRQLLLFSRKQHTATEVLDLNVAVREVGRLLPRLIGSDVTLELALNEGPLLMRGDSGQVGQILMNLVVNANDALPNGGTITVETAQVELDQDFVRRHPSAEVGPSVRLRITDTGLGMSEAVRAQVFEPFFTTKSPGKGTGLGLSAVYGIVRAWNGSVDVTSVVGRGTSITIYIPASDPGSGAPIVAAPSAHETIVTTHAHTPSAGATVLLVDDDDAVRSVVCRVLTAEGYRVLEAASGVEALRLLDDGHDAVDVVLSDMVMPGMGGRDLAYEVRNRYPAAMLVLMSGYTREILKDDDPIRMDTIFIQKPFTAATIIRAIQEARASAPRAGTAAAEAARPERRAGSERRALDALVNGIDALVWEADATTNRYHYVSRRAESLLGYPRERWHDEGFFSRVMHPEDRERITSLRRVAVGTGAGFSAEYRMLSATGEAVWIRDTVCIVSAKRGGRTQLGGVMIDITVAKDAMAVLTLAKETAERADAAKSEFIKLVSHELHTPLNAVIGFANILLKNRLGNMTEKDLSFVARIAANGRQLLEIVRNVLDVTRMQAGTLDIHLAPVNIDELVDQTVHDLEGAAMDKKLVMTAIVPFGLLPIVADPLRLRQVLTNVLGNAIKYTAAGSITVRLHAAADGVTPSRIEIVDTGQGIQADKLETVFNTFYQAEDFTRRRHDGAGMGLGIARGLCDRMGFTLSLDSVFGAGTTCVIDLTPRHHRESGSGSIDVAGLPTPG